MMEETKYKAWALSIKNWQPGVLGCLSLLKNKLQFQKLKVSNYSFPVSDSLHLLFYNSSYFQWARIQMKTCIWCLFSCLKTPNSSWRKLRKWIWLMYFLYKNEYRIFKPIEITLKKETKVERRKIEGWINVSYNIYITWNVTIKYPV
jgi:hypothetical protein